MSEDQGVPAGFLTDWQIHDYAEESNKLISGDYCAGQLSACGYDLRAGSAGVSKSRSRHFNLSERAYEVLPGESIAVESMEEFDLSEIPAVAIIGNSVGELFGGVAHPITIVDPGFKGKVSIVLTNHGNSPWILAEGARVAKVLFAMLAETPKTPYNKGYQQRQRPGALEGMRQTLAATDAVDDTSLSTYLGEPLSGLVRRVERIEHMIPFYEVKVKYSLIIALILFVSGIVTALVAPRIADMF